MATTYRLTDIWEWLTMSKKHRKALDHLSSVYQGQIDTLTSERDTLAVRCETLNKLLLENDTALSKVCTEVDRLEARNADSEDIIKNREAEIVDLRKQLDQCRSEYQQHHVELSDEIIRLKAQIEKPGQPKRARAKTTA